jgi:polysaccharide biosynthesis PFTS motif protein
MEYYIPWNANKFLKDTHEVIKKVGGVMVFKRKRDVGRRLHRSYHRTIQGLIGTSNFQEFDPDISASALIENCIAVISAPYTSTALIGRRLGKPSVYYDPNGICEKDDRAAHGIPILSGVSELREWIGVTLEVSGNLSLERESQMPTMQANV